MFSGNVNYLNHQKMQYKKQLRRHKPYLLSTYQSHKFYGGVCRVGRGWPTNDYILEKNVRHKYISKPRYLVIYNKIDQWFWYKCRFVPREAAVKYKHERRTFRDKLWLITEYFLYVNESMSCNDMPQKPFILTTKRNMMQKQRYY